MVLQVGFGKAFGIYLLVLFHVILNVLTDEQCIKKTPCRCEFENGTGVDFSAVPSSFYEATYITKLKGNKTFEIFTYFFHPCGDAEFIITDPTITENHCEDKSLSICRKVFNITMVDPSSGKITDNKYERVGWSQNTKFSNDGSAVIYSNGESDTTIYLACTHSDYNDLVIQPISEGQPDHYVLTFHTKEACLKTFTVEHHPSLGSVLIIILIVMTLTYLLMGMGTLYFSGARGIEIIPNLSFWVGLPGLMRDGVSYIRNGCKLPPTTAMPDHYDSI